ncbi:MAG: helix-turn-helix transcriptional regulator, partial [Clostridia bacterium]|nr:helix-turn-helix transcriptional regulator [Clostridia bacterium]
MNIRLGEKLKSLRKEKNISQEKLAQYLDVSFQAVSRWENSSTYPDIELLPELARFFGITVDELLGAEQIDEKKLYEEYEARAAEFYRNGDISGTLPIWQEAYHRLPNNIGVKEMLMSTYFDIDKVKYQKEIVELGTEIYNGSGGSYYKGQAVWQIARTYAACGNREMAERWALKSHQLNHSMEFLFVEITDNGEEMLSQFRFANYWYLNNLFYMSAKMAGCKSIPGGTEYIQAVSKTVTQMYELA